MKVPSISWIPYGRRVQGIGTVKPYTTTPLLARRNSISTEVTQDKVVQELPIDMPRFYWKNKDGAILSEIGKVNFVKYSSDWSNAAWAKTNITLDSGEVIAPNGKDTLSEVIPTTSSAQHYMQQIISTTVGVEYTFSIYVKGGESNKVELLLADNVSPYTDFARLYFDLDTLAATSPTTLSRVNVEEAGNGWYRISVTDVATNASTILRIILPSSTGALNWAGNGVGGVYLWGAQLEIGGNASSYIPTEATTASRDSDYIIGLYSKEIFKGNGSVLYDTSAFYDDTSSNYISIGGYTTSDYIRMHLDVYNETGYIDVSRDGVTATVDFDMAGGVRQKVLIVFVGATIELWVDGEYWSTTAFAAGAFDQMTYITNRDSSNSLNNFNGHIHDIRVYNLELNDEEKKQVTTI